MDPMLSPAFAALSDCSPPAEWDRVGGRAGAPGVVWATSPAGIWGGRDRRAVTRRRGWAGAHGRRRRETAVTAPGDGPRDSADLSGERRAPARAAQGRRAGGRGAGGHHGGVANERLDPALPSAS